jgi:hypothetical protein
MAFYIFLVHILAKSKSKPTFNMATGSPKEPKKNTKSKGKPQKSQTLDRSLPVANHIKENGLNKPMSTSDADLSKTGGRKSPKPVSSLTLHCQCFAFAKLIVVIYFFSEKEGRSNVCT